MAKFDLKKFKAPEKMKLGKKEAVMIANGDERRPANLSGWPGQKAMEAALTKAFKKEGWKLTRAHKFDPALGHGFIESLAQADEIFDRIPKDAVLVVAESVWEFSYMVVFRLWEHDGPILIASNFDGSAPGLVGALGLEACLTKHKYGPHQKGHSILWSSEEFKDAETVKNLREFLKTGRIKYDTSHAKPLAKVDTTGYKRRPRLWKGPGRVPQEETSPDGRLRSAVHGHVERGPGRGSLRRDGNFGAAAQPVRPLTRKCRRSPRIGRSATSNSWKTGG